jgi:hypothetical protein
MAERRLRGLLLFLILALGPGCRPSPLEPISIAINLAYGSDEDPVSEQGCTRCEPVAFVSAWGAALTVVVDSERGFALSREELESVTLLELPAIDDPDRGGWLVIADLTPGAQGKADSFSAAYPHSLVLVRIDGVPTSAHPLDDWDLGLMLAAFRQRQEAETLAAKLELPIVVRPGDPTETEAIRGDLRKLEKPEEP